MIKMSKRYGLKVEKQLNMHKLYAYGSLQLILVGLFGILTTVIVIEVIS